MDNHAHAVHHTTCGWRVHIIALRFGLRTIVLLRAQSEDERVICPRRIIVLAQGAGVFQV